MEKESMTTLPAYSSLTDEDKATMVAESMGFYLSDHVWVTATESLGQELGYENITPPYKAWNPSHSLDQCFLFEEWLIKNYPTKFMEYSSNLTVLISSLPFLDIHATASQRCRAFLITMCKVKE